MRGLVVVIAALCMCSAAAAQDVPRECQADASGGVNWRACLDVTPPDAPWRSLALINLGSDAFMRDDFAEAVRNYDAAIPPGQQIYSDVVFHTFRGVAYWRVGRRDEGIRDADIAFRMLQRDPMLPLPVERYLPPGVSEELVYALILPVLAAGNPQRFNTALNTFRALPAEGWQSYATRAAVFEEIGDLPGALEMSERALALAPDDAQVLNNHCYVLLRADRARDALQYCERAVATEPNVAAVRHSIASVFAALGRCDEAQRELAEARRLDPVTVEYQRPLECRAA